MSNTARNLTVEVIDGNTVADLGGVFVVVRPDGIIWCSLPCSDTPESALPTVTAAEAAARAGWGSITGSIIPKPTGAA